MIQLAEGYEAAIDRWTAETWGEVLSRFDEASIYQTWSYGAVRQGSDKLSHLVLRYGACDVAAAQIRLMSLPLVGEQIAFVRWGPMMQQGPSRPEVLRQALRALRNEYVCRRGMLLRVLPRVRDVDGELLTIFQQEGFAPSDARENRRTLLLDLTADLKTIRAGMRKTWRAELSKAERANLQVVCGEDDGLYDEFTALFGEMSRRKRFFDGVSVDEFRRIQASLPISNKMQIWVCRAEGEPCAAAVVSAVGKTGLYVFGASNELGRQTKAAYLLQWSVVQRLKSQGCTVYDLNGINPDANPGTYVFKAGLCGTANGADVTFMECQDSYVGLKGQLIALSVDRVKSQWHKLRSGIAARNP
jgi:lipid II:glycine glycyltransferase (peptidoglycan interpeptide bridge formation enzyme)